MVEDVKICGIVPTQTDPSQENNELQINQPKMPSVVITGANRKENKAPPMFDEVLT